MLNYMLLCPAAFCGEARCAGAVSVSAFDAFLNKGIRRRKQLIGFLLGFLRFFCGSTDVKLQLGFCSARADNNGGVSAFAESKTKNIALRQLSSKRKIKLEILCCSVGLILKNFNLVRTELLRRFAAEVAHCAANAFHALTARKGVGFCFFNIAAEFFVNLLQHVPKS